MNPRLQAIQEIRSRKAVPPIPSRERSSKWFGELVFSAKLMKRYVPEDVLSTLQELIDNREILTKELARPLASSIKAWALDKGATHYAHWLQPLNGQVAEKHNSFLDFLEGEAIDSFSSEQLRQEQPDESSFPADGQRSTFEARGSMVWDCQSPIFIFDTTYGRTLVIPSLFVSHSGEALDYKLPLLQSMEQLEKAALPVCHLFDPTIKRVVPTLGLEQEYFLVDKSLYDLRPDLVLTGRALLGNTFAHNRPSNFSYFNAIPARVYAFMNELEQMAHRLGIPLKTRHNEIAPAQYESASKYEQVNLAIDHGLMVMDLIQRVARKHSFAALLHEKPFDGIAGSSKHNNWSLETDQGKNLLSPGATPSENLMFLIFFVSMIRALHAHAPFVGAMMASAGNDLRLGSDAAPPSMLSLFVGRHLTKVLQDIETPPRRKKNEKVTELEHLGIAEIPQVLFDNTDRNRTSPIAFTGNKFEFRMVGSSSNCAGLMILLNLILAEQLREFQRRVVGKMNRGRKKQAAILDILREYIAQSKHICYEGDSQLESWIKEGKQRGLFHLTSTPEALQGLTSKEALSLFEGFSQGSMTNLRQYQASLVQAYLNQGVKEVDLFLELIQTHLIPLCIQYQTSLLTLLQLQKSQKLPSGKAAQQSIANTLGKKLDLLFDMMEDLQKKLAKFNKEVQAQSKALIYAKEVRPLLPPIQTLAQDLENMLPDASWPLPKIRELLQIY